MRTYEEIKKKIETPDGDLLGFMRAVLLPFLPYEHAKSLLRPEATEAEWTKLVQPPTRETVIKEISEYMSFAWEKAADHRGISAYRSISKIGAWLWLLGDDDPAYVAFEAADYPRYGAPQLKAACIALGLPMTDDPGALRMAEGESCRFDCNEGCNS
jgi:hypothetical protein